MSLIFVPEGSRDKVELRNQMFWTLLGDVERGGATMDSGLFVYICTLYRDRDMSIMESNAFAKKVPLHNY